MSEKISLDSSERIYKFHKKIRKVSRHEKAQDFD